jgi:hypothetical protein
MIALTKDQVQNLTPEQQDIVGTLEANRIKKRRQLLETARGYRGMKFIEMVTALVLALIVLGLYCYRAPTVVIVILGAGWLWISIQHHATCLNRRLDALMELLESDKKIGDD